MAAAWGGSGRRAERLRARLHLPGKNTGLNKGCKSSANHGNGIVLKLYFQGEILVDVTVCFCRTVMSSCDF